MHNKENFQIAKNEGLKQIRWTNHHWKHSSAMPNIGLGRKIFVINRLTEKWETHGWTGQGKYKLCNNIDIYIEHITSHHKL